MTSPREPVAIVGIGCRFPGGVDSPETFWRALLDEVDAIGEIPRDRFDLDVFYDPRPATPGKVNTRFGGFLSGIDTLDAEFFGIAPREAERLDPQQRLLLEVGFEALEDAGLPIPSLAGSPTGVFVGMWLNEYEGRLFSDALGPDFYMTTGSGRYSASGRLSYAFGLQGPSLTIDTACSSSLAAVHLACQSLWSGESRLALAGGANVILQPHISIAYSQSQMLAPDGRCKFADSRADGYVRSEGAALVALKPLGLAERDGDRIYAVILGGTVNNDGRSSGFMTTPGQGGQEDMLRKAYRHAGVSPGQVGYVEAHGTGTRAGDPVELGALGAVLAEGRRSDRPCAVGSVKTNFGHTESAAGVAGLIKAALSLQHGLIPASLHMQTPNPGIPWSTLPLYVPTAAMPWPAADGPRLAGVSAFGISGTNAHVVLAGAPVVSERRSPAPPRAHLLVLSATREEALVARARDYRDLLVRGPGKPAIETADVCHTAGAHRNHYSFRLAAVGETAADLADRLEAFAAHEARPGLVSGQPAAHRTGKTAFVFPGQGSQWLGMGRELRQREPAFQESLEKSDVAIRAEAGFSILEQLLADPSRSRLAEIDVVQPVLFAVEVALCALWRAYGIRPDVMVGHSMGEVAAAHAAGILSLEDAVRVICRRSRLLRSTRGRGAMAVVELSLEEASRALKGCEDRLSVAVSNSSRSTVLSGDPGALDEMIAALEKNEVFCRRIKVDVASHSPQMDPLAPELLAALPELAPCGGTVPLFSTVEARLVDGRALTAPYWVRNLRQPVLFSAVVRALAEQGFDTFIEMSPHPILLPALQQETQLAGRAVAAVPSLKREEPEQATFLESLGVLYTEGHDIDWRALDAPGARLVSLPPYPWQRERFWFETKGAAASRPAAGLLGRHLTSSLEAGTHYWETEIGTTVQPYLADHTVNGVVVMPAAAFVEMMLCAAADLGPDKDLSLVDLAIESALVLPAEGARTVQVAASPGPEGDWSFRISSLESNAADRTVAWTLHARGTMRREGPLASAATLTPPALSDGGPAHYAAMAARGLDYGPAFRTVAALTTAPDGAWSRLALPDGLATHGYRVHPSLLDACFQVGLAVLPEGTSGETYVPVAIDALRSFTDPAAGSPHTAHAVLREPGSGSLASQQVDIVVADANGRRVLQVEGLRFQHVPRDQAVAASLFAVAWDKEPKAPTSVPASAGAWLMVADAGGTGAALAARLRSRGHSVEVAQHSDLADQESLRALLAGTGRDPAPRTIVHLASLDARSPDASGLEALAEARALGCDGVVRLVQAAVAQVGSTSPRLVLVTAGAQAVLPGDVPAVEQSPLWGLGRVIASEHPELACGLVDLPRAPTAADLDGLADLLGGGQPIEQVALRGGDRFFARLRPWKPEPERSEPVHMPAGARSFRAVASTPGILDGLVLHAAARRAPGPGQVEIEVAATGLNFMNVMSALGIYPGYPNGVGSLGIECSGRIAAVGEHVSGLAVGDEVLAVAFDSLATHAIADARLVRRKPAGLGLADAAGIPIVFLTAHYALDHLARLQKRERVLIHAAAGGVGLAAIQLAQRLGAEVFATAGSPEKRALLESLGVRHVMDSRSLAFREDVLARTGGEGVDVVLNSLAGEFIAASLSVLKPYGRFLEIGKRDIYRNTKVGLAPFQRNLSYFALDLDRMIRERPDRVASLLDEVMALLDEGAVSALPTAAFPVSRVGDAFRHMAQARHTGKLVVTLHDAAAQTDERPSAIASFTSGTCLVTGGLGGLGLAVARFLADQGAPALALMGRRPPDITAGEAIAGLERAGAKVKTFEGDVANAADVKRIVAEIDASLPSLSGIVHAAGLLDDGILLQQTAEKFARVMAPKVEGAFNLHAALAGRPNVGLVLFSSVSALVGLPGQGNYAAGNAFLDALAHARRARGLLGTSINWGPWSAIGLAAAQENRGGRLARGGLRSLRPSDGIEAFGLLLANSPAEVAVMPLDWASYAHAHPASARSGFLSALAADAVERGAEAASAPGASGVKESLLAADPGPRRRATLETYLREQVAQVLRQAPARIDVNKPLRTLGLDSLMGLELRNRLEASLGLTLPATLVWNYPTVAALGPQLAERLGIPLDAPATASPVSSQADGTAPGGPAASDEDIEALLRDVEDLSAEEVRRLLTEGS